MFLEAMWQVDIYVRRRVKCARFSTAESRTERLVTRGRKGDFVPSHTHMPDPGVSLNDTTPYDTPFTRTSTVKTQTATEKG